MMVLFDLISFVGMPAIAILEAPFAIVGVIFPNIYEWPDGNKLPLLIRSFVVTTFSAFYSGDTSNYHTALFVWLHWILSCWFVHISIIVTPWIISVGMTIGLM